MIRRTRPDGNKFQQDVSRALEKLEIPNYPIRLHTTTVRQLSDFIIFSKTVSILEVKETTANSFSTRTMQQKEKVEEFQEFLTRTSKILGNLPYRIYILVRFIKERVYMVYDATEQLAILHATGKEGPTFSTLNEALEYIVRRTQW
jgi:hypothetical protein